MSNEYTREWWKERLPLIQAFAEGKQIQVEVGMNTFEDCPHPTFALRLKNYRIAPEHKLRPWKPEEVPVGALIRTKGAGDCRHLIVAVSDDGGILAGRHYSGGFDWCLERAEHSTDNGKTWAPCGVMEEQQ